MRLGRLRFLPSSVCSRLLQSRPAFDDVAGVKVRLGAGADELGAPPNRDESMSAIGLPACPRGGGMAKYRVAISVRD
jgi:hypothetical protein